MDDRQGGRTDGVGDDTDRRIGGWTELVPGMDPVVEGVVDRVTLLARYLERLTTRTARPFGLSQADYEVMARLYWVGPPHRLTPTQLAAGMMTRATTVTSRLDRLERADLVARSADPLDRRSLRAELTERGKTLFLEVVERQARAERELFDRMPRQDLEALETLLRQAMLQFADLLGPAPRRAALALGTVAPTDPPD